MSMIISSSLHQANQTVNQDSSPPTSPRETDFFLLKAESLQNIAAGKCDAIFAKILEECVHDREKANDLAYALFSGPRCPNFTLYNESGIALIYLLLDKELSNPDLCRVIKNAFEELKRQKVSESQAITNSRELKAWDGLKGEVITVLHGGGRRHIEAFLKGSSDAGYKCDSDYKGIFLTPSCSVDTSQLRSLVMNSRAPLYATRTPLYHCDDPQVIVGTVPKKYLYSVNSNSYEVVLKREDALHLTLLYSETIKATVDQLRIFSVNNFLEKFEEDPELKARLKQSFKRLNVDD